MTNLKRLLSAAALATVLVACDDDGTGPTVESVAGTYTATRFTATTFQGLIDLLAGGASITAALNTDGTTEGRLVVPAELAGGTAVDADLSGTWTLDDDRVTFTADDSDTFFTDLVFNVRGNRLEASGTFSGAVLEVVLTK